MKIRNFLNKKKDLNQEENTKPEIKDLGKEFFKEIKGLNQAQKINIIYQSLFNKKPDINLSIDKICNRILYQLKFGKYIEGTNNFLKKKNKKFKVPFKWKQIFKLSKKKKNEILVWYFNVKGEIEMPKLYPIYSSNMVIIKNRPYEVDPRSFWRFGKYLCQAIKGIDRRPISNLDYDEIKKRGDSTDSDELLIKAASSMAIEKGKDKKPLDKKVLIVIGIIILVAIVFFMSQS